MNDPIEFLLHGLVGHGHDGPKYKLAVEEAPLTIIIDFSPTSSKQLELIVVLFTRHFLHVMSRVK